MQTVLSDQDTWKEGNAKSWACGGQMVNLDLAWEECEDTGSFKLESKEIR